MIVYKSQRVPNRLKTFLYFVLLNNLHKSIKLLLDKFMPVRFDYDHFNGSCMPFSRLPVVECLKFLPSWVFRK